MKYQLFEVKSGELFPVKNSDKLHQSFFFGNGADLCYRLSSHIENIIDSGIDELKLNLAERETNSDYFYCRFFGRVGEKSDGGCGKMCKGYEPRNGKSGICKHSGYTYDNTGREFLLRLNQTT